VPLNEREQRILEEIERNLIEEDPSLAQDATDPVTQVGDVRRAKLGAVVFVLGFLFLIGFFLSRSIVVGVLAFGAMVGGIVLLASAMSGVFLSGRTGATERKQRITSAFEQWEARIKERYKRR
jgi:hypothetical protein